MQIYGRLITLRCQSTFQGLVIYSNLYTLAKKCSAYHNHPSYLHIFTTFVTSGLVHPYQLDESILVLGVSGECFHFYCIFARNSSEANSADPDQMPKNRCCTLRRHLNRVRTLCICPKKGLRSKKGQTPTIT